VSLIEWFQSIYKAILVFPDKIDRNDRLQIYKVKDSPHDLISILKTDPDDSPIITLDSVNFSLTAEAASKNDNSVL
jgi:hypothetical protein